MNKTLQQIIDEMIAKKNGIPALVALTSSSKVSIWRLILEMVAFVIFNFQEAVKLHMDEINQKIAEQKVPSLRWYRNEALKFQYGFDLLPESDQFSPTYEITPGNIVTATPEQIENSKVIKYVAVDRIENTSKISMKIATEVGGEIVPITDVVAFAFKTYVEEYNAAGENIVIVNYLADILKIDFNIVYDPLVLLANGTSILSATEPVKFAIQQFLKTLPFNGELSVQKLEAAVLAVEGVEDLQNLQVQTKWIEPGVGYGQFQPVQIKTIPKSGYFKIEDYTGINFIV